MSGSFAVVDPSIGEAFTEVAMASAAEVDRAVGRAVRAQARWAALAPLDRARLLRRFAAVVDARGEELAALEVRNSGHPVDGARWEAGHVRDVLEYFSAAPERLIGKQIPVAGGIDVTFHEPLGVVGVIVPWNFPMTIAAWGFAPALAAGNAVVLKPAEWTPLTALRLAELALEAGLPDGLLQAVPGTGAVAGEALVRHPDVAKVVFTGSTATGSRVMALAAEQVKPVTLELGGKSANLVFADADLDAAAAAAPGAVFDNAGQDCCARSRILVERSVLDAFLERLEPAVRAWRVGDPRQEGVQMGPLVSAAHRDRVASFLDGRTPLMRGSAPDGPGFWFAPAVVLPEAPDDRLLSEEVFGPVVAVQAFEGEAEGVALANATRYGLSGSIWTRDLGRGLRVSRAVRSGALSVNSNSSVRYTTPFGGMKRSGIGRELGPDAPLHFTDEKNVFYATGDPA
ncbi:aldehyde dehydrogenase family protein [Amnibacterium endophyticum]|uniref:Aldehyde dehydrogenase family protein n=1 Tax=Amnibacterium endophyticum TaxID=2109337 RepID=A0ABW4L954_9MICO